MPQFKEADAANLSSEQATGLIHVLELQARWKNHCADPTMSAASPPDLQARRNVFDAFQVASNAYTAKYRHAQLPEPTQTAPERLVVWCRVLRAVFQRAEAGYPVELMAKVHRLALRSAEKRETKLVEREFAKDKRGAICELDAVIAWCDELLLPST